MGFFDYTTAQWLEHRWLQAKVPMVRVPSGDSQFLSPSTIVSFLTTFPSNQLIIYDVCVNPLLRTRSDYREQFVGYSEGCVPPACVDS